MVDRVAVEYCCRWSTRARTSSAAGHVVKTNAHIINEESEKCVCPVRKDLNRYPAFTSAKRSLFRKRPCPSRPLGTSAIRMTPLQVAPTTLSRADPLQLHPQSDTVG
jgi:hypothetical protein